MFHVLANQSEQLLSITYSLHVDREQTERCVEEVKVALDGLKPGFRLLVDLSGLEQMEPSCAISIREIMKLCNDRKISAVARVIPDPRKDIGLHLMSYFHYGPDVRLMTSDNLADAMNNLAA